MKSKTHADIPRARRQRLALLLLATTTGAAAETPLPLSPVVVTATRSAQSVDTLPSAVSVFTAADLAASPSLALDDTLRSEPAFSLYRRSGSLTANPTAQGVSLRGLGPSGTSRSLVLLDGVPLNDPFGGWVSWTKIPALSLAGAEIVRGGGSGTWGNAALGGTIQLLTQPPAGNRGSAQLIVGDFDTFSGEVAITQSAGASSVSIDASAFTSSGVDLVRNPGPIDQPADLAYQRAQASWRTAFTDTLALTVTARIYDEDRGNGTPLQRNASHETFLSATLAGSAPAGGLSAWSATVYFQDQAFSSFFSSVDAARTAETPASNQYDVPATAAGGALTATWGGPADDAITTIGADLRWVQGETRESYNWNAPASIFLGDRRTGGEQAFAGLFARHDHAVSSTVRLSAGARVDYWQNTDGFLREQNTVTNVVTTDTHFGDEHGVEFSPNLGLVWQAARRVRLRASVYQAFRVPTLNEYYRPFRVGPVTTAANPALSPEKLTGAETGFDFGTEQAGASLTAFVNELHDAATNVTTGLNTRQRRNLDDVRVQGIEASAHLRPWTPLLLETSYLLSDARVIDPGSGAASLDGRRLSEVPRNTLSVGATWNAPAAFVMTARLRWTSAQFEDDENTLRLAPATTVDLGVSRRFGHGWTAFVAVENVFDTQPQTGRTTAGVVSIGPPRWTHAGLRYDW